MTTYLILGATYAFAAAVQPGPLQTFLFAQTLRHGWRRALPAALAPLVSDGPIVLLTLLVLHQMPPWLLQALRLAGGVFLLYLAFNTVRAARTFAPVGEAEALSAPRSVLQAALVNLLNPNPYLAWSLVMGPLLLEAWRETPLHGLVLLAGFYGTLVLGLAGTILFFALARPLGPRVNRILLGVAAVGLAGFGIYLLWLGLAGDGRS